MAIPGRNECDRTRENLSLYMDQRLDAGSRQKVEQHLSACPRCREDLETLRITVGLLHRVPLEPVPRSFALPATVVPMRRGFPAVRALGLAAACLAFMLIGLVGAEVIVGGGAETRLAPSMVSAPAKEAGSGTEPTAAAAAKSDYSRAAPSIPSLAPAPAGAMATPTAAAAQAFAAGATNAAPTPGKDAGVTLAQPQAAPASTPTAATTTQTSSSAAEATAPADAGGAAGAAVPTQEAGVNEKAAEVTGTSPWWRIGQLGLGSLALVFGAAWAVLRQRR